MSSVGYIFFGALLLLSIFFVRHIRARRRNLSKPLMPQEEIVLQANRVPIRAMSYGTAPVMGLDPKRAVRLTGRMAMSKERFVLVTDQGRFTDIRIDQKRLLTSARCTAPGRLVIEGTIPQAGRSPGVYRLELLFEQATEWALALQPFVDSDAPKFGVMPPSMSGSKPN